MDPYNIKTKQKTKQTQSTPTSDIQTPSECMGMH